MSVEGALFLSPFAGTGLGEGRREGFSLRRSFSQNTRITIGETDSPRHPSPNPLPTPWGEGLEHRA
jgi:hypothetical protein